MGPIGFVLRLGLSLSVLGAAQASTSSLDVVVGRTAFKIEPWGVNSVRVRANTAGPVADLAGRGALLPPGADNKGHPVRSEVRARSEGSDGADGSTGAVGVDVDESGRMLVNGNIKAQIGTDGLVTITRTDNGKTVLREVARPVSNAVPAAKAGEFTVAVNNSAADCSAGPCCLDLSNWNTAEHAPVGISNCHTKGEFGNRDGNQRWHPVAVTADTAGANTAGGAVQLVVQLGGKCLSVNDDGGVEAATCSTADTKQHWTIPPKPVSPGGGGGGGGVQHSTGGCLAIATRKGRGPHDGGTLDLEPCNATSQLQQWTFSVPAPGPAPGPPGPPGPPAPFSAVSFGTAAAEVLYGFGEHQQGKLQLKPQAFDMEDCLDYGHSHGGEVCLPWIIAATAGKGVDYGFLWNMPNYGGVDFGRLNSSVVTWTAVAATQTDYFITIPDPDAAPAAAANQVMHSYVDAVGHVPHLPRYAAGYWHSRNRYASQAELLSAAQGFHDRNITVAVIVIDYNHWARMGDWSFDPAAWPDVPAMMTQLEAFGMRVMVSAWPFSATNSTSFNAIGSQRLAFTTLGTADPIMWDDNNCGDVGGPASCYIYDPTLPAARQYFWSRLSEGYYKHGIKIFWLDASEPEISTPAARNAAFDYNSSIGSGQEMGMMYPYYHTQSIHDGLISERESDVVMLTRSAWAGMQRFGAALWSGDTHSHWSSLKVSIQAGLNTQMSGIAWWTTDIGGYSGGNPSDPEFRELIVRWFQFGLTCPLFRQHGERDTAPWGYGNQSLAAIEGLIALRTQLEPYIMKQMELASSRGVPINRPLWWDFPEDAVTWDIDAAYMFGSDYLVCPVTDPGVASLACYLPALPGGAVWTHHYTKQQYAGGANVTTATPLDQFPLFSKGVAAAR